MKYEVKVYPLFPCRAFVVTVEGGSRKEANRIAIEQVKKNIR